MTESVHSRRILRNIVYGLSTWILPIFLGLVSTRVIVRSLGNSDYGIYALVLGFIAYSFNFSIGRAVTKYLATYRATGETEKIRGLISSTAIIAVGLALIGSLMILAISNWLVVDVFEIEQASQTKTILALQLSAATIFAMLIGQIATSVLQGLHRFDIFSRIQNGTSIIALLGNLLLAYNGFGLLALLLWNLTVTITSTIVAFVYARRLLPEFGFSLTNGRDMTMLVLQYSASVVGYQILTNAFFIFERSWVVSNYGSESLTFYVIPMTLGIYLHGFIFSVSMFLFPLASELDSDRTRLLVLYRGATKGVLSIVAILATTLVILGRPFLTLWLGNEFGERSGGILVIHTLAFGLAALVIVSHQTAEATGQPLFNFRNMAIGVAIAVPLTIFTTGRYGLAGIALGRLAIFIVTVAAIAILERKTFGNIQSKYWSALLLRIGVAVVITALVEKAISSILPVSWLSLAITGTAGLAVYALVLFFLGTVSDEDRRLLHRMVNREA